jgi:hypothetical protein
MIEKEKLKFKELEHVRIKKVEQLFLGHAPRAFSDPMESEKVSSSLFYRIFFTRTGVHFA